MNSKHSEWKVGLFVFAALVLLALLMLNFSKGFTALKQTYDLRMRTTDVGGIKAKAAVLLAGVPVGTVKDVTLAPDGKSVFVTLRIEERFKVYGDALFVIESAGFLGDQYVAIVPQANAAPLLKHGDEVECREPFDVQEAARAALGLIQRVDQTVAKLNQAVTRIDETVLSPATLGRLTNTFANISLVSEKAVGVADSAGNAVASVQQLVTTNAPSIQRSLGNVERFTEQLHTITNLLKFSEQLSDLAVELRQTVATNRQDITAAVKHLEEASELSKLLLADLNAGKGLAGSLLKDEALSRQMSLLMNNLTTVSSNLARFGLFHKPKPVKTNDAAPLFPYPAQQRNR